MKISFFLYFLLFLFTRSALDSLKILAEVLEKVGASQEEALLVSAEYLKVKDVDSRNILNEFLFGDFQEFWKEWRLGLFKDRLKINLKGLSEENALNLLTFEMFKIMTWNFEDYLKTLDLKPKNEKNLKCANEKHSSFHI
jgi:hypothetical protein